MKNLTRCCIILSLLIVVSCAEKKEEIENSIKSKPMVVLPFQKMALSDLADFEIGPTNWKITGGINSDRSKEEFIETIEGTGILVNTYAKDKSENLFSTFEHGDIEIEFDVMLSKGSNSGIYFQSRYELQLFDSWGELEPKHGDMGGIYERWDKSNDEGSLGFDGHAPKVNASKAPGLWQHLKVVFHAPKFDESGSKIKNAWFEEVWLNGALLHKNVELTGPTRAASFEYEQAMGAGKETARRGHRGQFRISGNPYPRAGSGSGAAAKPLSVLRSDSARLDGGSGELHATCGHG